MASQARVPAEIENINELWGLLEQKDDDLKYAAELGKMLLDEKEADAEAHEAEKDALWRRIEEMATRVVELEQESAEAYSLLQQARAASYDSDHGMIVSVSSASEREEEATLRAKNEVLERQLTIMREQLDETKLELTASRKAQLYMRASRQSSGRSRRSLSPSTSPPPSANKLREHSSDPASGDDTSGSAASFYPIAPLSIGQRMPTPPEKSEVSQRESPLARPASVAVSSSQASPGGVGEKVSGEATKSTGDAKEQETSWLLEQNASLMVELESKDELIEALRQQLKQQQQSKVQQLGIRGQLMSPCHHALPELSECDSDDCGDENEDPDDETRERSFMDDLLEETGRSPGGVIGRSSNDTPRADEDKVKEESFGAATAQPPASQGRRSFGGLLVENVPLKLSGPRRNEEPETVAKTDGKKLQTKNPPKADRENSPIRGKKRSSLSPSRRRSLDQAKGASPATAPGHKDEDVTGVMGRSATIAAPFSATLTTIAGALETWPQSPRGVPLSWSSAMRALAMIAPVGQREHRSLEESEPETAQSQASEVTVSNKSGMVQEVQAGNKGAPGVEDTQAPVSPEIVKPETAMKEQDLHDGEFPVSPGFPKPIVAMEELEVENLMEDKKFFSSVKEEAPISPESLKPETVVRGLEIKDIEASLVDDEFDPLEEQKPPSPENVQAEVLMKEIVGSVQASAMKVEFSDEQAPMSPESSKPETMTKEQEMEDAQASVVEGDKFNSAGEHMLPYLHPVQAEVPMKEVLAIKDGTSSNEQVPISPESLKPKKMTKEREIENMEANEDSNSTVKKMPSSPEPVQTEIPTEEVLAMKDDTSFNEQAPTSPESLQPEAITKKLEIEDVQASMVEDDTSNSAREQMSLSPEPVQTEMPMEEVPVMKDDTSSKVHAPTSPESVKPKTMAKEKEIEDPQVPVVEDITSTAENKPSFPESVKTEVLMAKEEVLALKDDTLSYEQARTSPKSLTPETIAKEQEADDVQADDKSNPAGDPISLSQEPVLMNAEGILAMKDDKSSSEQPPSSPESIKPETIAEEIMEGPEACVVEDVKSTSAEEHELRSPEPVQTEVPMKVALTMKDHPSFNEQAPISPEFVKPETMVKEQEIEDDQASEIEGGKSNSPKDHMPSTPEPRQTEVQAMRRQVEDVQVLAVEDNKSFSADDQAFSILESVNAQVPMEKEKVQDHQAPAVDGETNSEEDKALTLSTIVKPEVVVTRKQEMKHVKPLAGDDGKSNMREGHAITPPEPLKSEVVTKEVKGGHGPTAEVMNGKSTKTLAPVAEPRYLAQNRAERKSRQAMAKLGLRTVAGVFRVTMKTSNGHIFVVKKPDVFKHPQQDTYVIFGMAGTDINGSEVHLPASRADREVPKVAQAAASAKSPSFAGPEAAKMMSASISVDPADVMSVMSLTGRGSECAIKALCEEGGDVVNAVMRLTEA